MLDPKNLGESQLENEKWKVFVLLDKNKQDLVLQKGSEVLYQVHQNNISSHNKHDVRMHVYGRIQCIGQEIIQY